MSRYSSLKIVKTKPFAWVYYPNGLSRGFVLSKGYCSGEQSTGTFQIVEEGKSRRPDVNISNITVQDLTSGPGTVKSYISLDELFNDLTILGNPLMQVSYGVPTTGNEFIKKPTQTFYIEGVGGGNPINYLSELKPFIAIGSYSGEGKVSGLNKWVGELPYTTMIFSIENQSSVDIPLEHNGTGDYKFIFPDNSDYVLKPKETVTFRISGGSRAVFIATNMSVNAEYVAGAIETAGFAQRTGTAIAFDKWATYGTYAVPITGNLSYSFSEMVKGMIQVIYHQDMNAPAVLQAGVTVIQSGDYVVDNVNKITVHCIDENVIELNIKAL